VTVGNDNGTDGQTDRQTDGQSATQYAAPPREEGRIIRRTARSNVHSDNFLLIFSK